MMEILVFLMLVLVQKSSTASSSCPNVCMCKWKGGKETVECTDKSLALIPDDVDSATQVLDMSGNNLQTLGGETFVRTGLLNLQRLYLRNCRLGRIDDRALRGLTNLVELDLSHNLLTSIPSATFKDVPYLRDLILARNPIQKIPGHAFMTLPGLVKLDLSNCELVNISPNAFEGVQLLESLKLNGNKLREIRPRTVETLSRLHGVELHDNPWYCDCHLRAAKIWLTDNNIPYPIAPRCSGGPERIIRRSFSELVLDDFACKPEIRLDSRQVDATAGDNATVVCRVDSIPEAMISWYWNGKPLLNNTAINSYQRAYILENGTFEKKSTLIVTNAQESDSSDFYCVAENRAGNAEANYTVHVSLRMAGVDLASGQIAGLSAALVLLILIILVILGILLMRLRRAPFSESKTPGGTVEVVANGTITQKPPTPVTVETSTFVERKEVAVGPVAVESPGDAPNPDLINDTREDPRPGSGEYVRTSDGWEEGFLGDRTPIVEDYPPDYGLPIPGGPPLPSAKTLRVWQRGVPVLPPVNALKRVLNRNSPDEGYQEGCGTDV